MIKKTVSNTSPIKNVLAFVPIVVLGYLLSINPQVTSNLEASYKMVNTQFDELISPYAPLSLSELELEGDKFNKRKVKQYLQDAFSYDDILNLHKTSISLMETYPKHEGKIQKLTIRVANENGYSFRFHPDDRSIIYRKLTKEEQERILAAEEEELEEEIAEVTPVNIEKTSPSVPPVALSIKAFPNPTAEKVTVSFTGNQEAAVLTIVNIQGQEVYREKITAQSNNFQRTIPISKFVKGMATIQVEQNGKTVQQKVIVIE